MGQGSLDKFGAYQKGLELFDLVVADMARLRKDPLCFRLVSQQVASADSICSNMEEGFGRLSRAEFVRFLDFSRASAKETEGRYRRMKRWLDEDVVQHRTQLAGEIVGILTTTIERLRREPSDPATRATQVKEDALEYVCDTGLPLDT
jgi:four helix bundle protein